MGERRASQGLTASVPSGDGRVHIEGLTMENGMGHAHNGGNAADIYPLGSDDLHLGCFSWQDGENVEKRWDGFALLLWEAGLEPVTDEPAFTVREGDVTYDHYVLVSIYR
jgi:hypothetical protein